VFVSVPPGIAMVAPPEVPRNEEGRKAKGRAKGERKKRGPGR